MLYLCAGDLFDDVQDEDLAGKPHAEVGPAIAVNSALALMFAGFEVLHDVMASDLEPTTRLGVLAAFNRVSMLGVGRQHADLTSASTSLTPAEVLERDCGKTSSVGLFTECGALLAGVSPQLVQAYRDVGESLAGLVQIVDDLRDIYGKDVSPDLATAKLTYPVACFEQLANDEQRRCFDTMLARLPASLPEIRTLFHDAGVVDMCALAIDEQRQRLHRIIATTNRGCAAHRLLLEAVDTVAAAVYVPEPVAETVEYATPSTEFDRALRAQVQQVYARIPQANLPAPPQLKPWHLPHFLYVPGEDTLLYPDVGGLAEEVLPFHSRLFGLSHEDTAGLLRGQLPLFVAHELAHHFRHHQGALSKDTWHEEFIANRFAVAYAHAYEPEALSRALDASSRLLADLNDDDWGRVHAVLAQCESPQATESIELDMQSAVIAHVKMVERLALLPLDFGLECCRLAARGGSATDEKTSCTPKTLPNQSDEIAADSIPLAG